MILKQTDTFPTNFKLRGVYYIIHTESGTLFPAKRTCECPGDLCLSKGQGQETGSSDHYYYCGPCGESYELT